MRKISKLVRTCGFIVLLRLSTFANLDEKTRKKPRFLTHVEAPQNCHLCCNEFSGFTLRTSVPFLSQKGVILREDLLPLKVFCDYLS